MGNARIDAAIELADHPKFEWKGGMKTACGTRLKDGWMIKKWIQRHNDDDKPVPDLDDPPTKGWLLDSVREFSGDPEAYVCKFEEGWIVMLWPEPNTAEYYSSEGIALAKYISGLSKFL